MVLGRGKGGGGRKGLLGLFHPLSHSEGRRGEVHTIQHHHHHIFSPLPPHFSGRNSARTQRVREWHCFHYTVSQKNASKERRIFSCFVCSLPTLQEHFLYRLVYCWGISTVFVLHAVGSEKTPQKQHHFRHLFPLDRRRKETSIRGIQIRIILAVGGREGRGRGGNNNNNTTVPTNPPFCISPCQLFPIPPCLSLFRRKEKEGSWCRFPGKKERRNRTWRFSHSVWS